MMTEGFNSELVFDRTKLPAAAIGSQQLLVARTRVWQREVPRVSAICQ